MKSDSKAQAEQQPGSRKTFREHVRETAETIVVAFILAAIIKTLFFQIFFIPSGSMIPTLEIGDRLAVIKPYYGIQNPIYNAVRKSSFLYWIPNPLYHKELPFSDTKYIIDFPSDPKRFDVVVFYPPETPVGGPIHEYRDQAFRRISFFKPPQKPGSDYIKRIVGLPGETIEIKDGYLYIDGKRFEEDNHLLIRDQDNFGPIQVPKGTYFAMGDNRPRSSDSRIWGFLPEENIVGKAVFRIWPVSRIGAIR